MGSVADNDEEGRRRQRTRNVAIAVALGMLVVLCYAATIVRLGPNALRKGPSGAGGKQIIIESEAAKKVTPDNK